VSHEELLRVAVLIALASPAFAVFALGGAAFAGLRLGERIVGSLSILVMSVSLVAFAVAEAVFAAGDHRPLRLSVLPVASDQAFSLDLLIDERSLLFAMMAAFICAIVAVFAHRYLHREPGYYRYFVHFNLFALGIFLIGVSGSMTLLFAGWEFVGISSAMLVAFFHERPMPLQNALRVFATYRLSDAAMLSAAVVAHQAVGTARLDSLFLAGDEAVPLSAAAATAIAVLLVIAAAGKCAQLPFSGWIPRAMEGPTPSSAVFYGAIAIHAGAFVLLRAGPVLEQAPVARALIIVMGVATALFATTVGRVQTDVKSALAFASLTQVSIILIEIALGLYWIALIHMAGHAFLRLLQFLRAPSILHDFHEATNAVGGHLGHSGAHLERFVPARWQRPLYRFALERGHLDAAIDRFVLAPVVALAAKLDEGERRICAVFAGRDGYGPGRNR
jgi:NAD(P)H-quinone oxidoreductase subunit 5